MYFIYISVYKNRKFHAFDRYFKHPLLRWKHRRKKDSKTPLHARAGKGRMRGRVGNANETEIKEKKSTYTYKQKDLQPRFGSRPAQTRERDGLEDAIDRGALDKRGDTGLIVAFTLTAHQSRSTTSMHPRLHVPISLPLSPSLMHDPEKRKSMNSEIRRGLPSVAGAERWTRRTDLWYGKCPHRDILVWVKWTWRPRRWKWLLVTPFCYLNLPFHLCAPDGIINVLPRQTFFGSHLDTWNLSLCIR